MITALLLALAAGLPGAFPTGDAGWFGSPGIAPRQSKTLLSPDGSHRLSFPVVSSDSCTFRAVTITDCKGRLLYQDSPEFSFGSQGDIFLAWDEQTVWALLSDGLAYYYEYLPRGTRSGPSWRQCFYGEAHRLFQDLPEPPPWLWPDYPGMHGNPNSVPPADEGFVVNDSGPGWSYRFEYFPVPSDPAFIRSVVMDDMRSFEAHFARAAEDDFSRWGDDPGWTDWVVDGTVSMVPAPEGFCTVIASWMEYTGGAHCNDGSTLYRYAGSATSGSETKWTRIGTRDLIADSTELVLLSGLVVDSLVRQLGQGCDKSWVRRGAGPTWDNYANLVPVPDSTGALAGFSVSFPSYAVAPFFAGPQAVFIPVALLGRHDVQR